MTNATQIYESSTLIRTADGIGFFFIALLLLAYFAWTIFLRRKNKPVSRITNWVLVFTLSNLVPFFWSFVLDLALLKPSLGVLLLIPFFTLITEMLALYSLMMIAFGFNVVSEKLQIESKSRLLLLYILGGIILLFSLIATILGFVLSSRILGNKREVGMQLQSPAVVIALILLPIVFLLTILGFILTFVVRFINAIYRTRDLISRMALPQQRKSKFDQIYFRFLVVSAVAVVLRFILIGSAIAVAFWHLGAGSDLIRLFSVFVSFSFCFSVAYFFCPTSSESMQLYLAAAENFTIDDEGDHDLE